MIVRQPEKNPHNERLLLIGPPHHVMVYFRQNRRVGIWLDASLVYRDGRWCFAYHGFHPSNHQFRMVDEMRWEQICQAPYGTILEALL